MKKTGILFVLFTTISATMIQHQQGNIVQFTYASFEQHAGVINVISSRFGGVSIAPFTSLNVGLHVGDDAEAVIRNRELLCSAINVDHRSIVTGKQVHGANVAIVTERERGRGSTRWEDGLPDTDGLITNVPDVPLLVLVADCALISFFDPAQRVVALAHAGWRGLVGRIAQRTVETMCERFGCDPRDILAGIGPSIGPCCYEVQEDVITSFRDGLADQVHEFVVRQPNGSRHLDLWTAARRQLVEAGIREEHVESANLCTACHTERFYSYRAEHGKTGRFGGLIALRLSRR